MDVKSILGIIGAAVSVLAATGALLLWLSANVVFADDLDQKLSPIESQLKQIRIENIEERVLNLEAEIAVLEYKKENSEWTGEDEVRLRTLLEQKTQLKKKLEN